MIKGVVTDPACVRGMVLSFQRSGVALRLQRSSRSVN
jgi:hypothetical protein